MAMSKRTQYGSGQVFVKTLTDELRVKFETKPKITQTIIDEIIDEVCVSDNQVGYLKGGYKFTANTETLSDQSDLGEMKVDDITKEKAECTFALFNANKDTIAAVYPTAIPGDGFVEVGGLEDMDDTAKVIIFKKTSKLGDEYAVCLGKNMSGFENAWTQDSVTPFQCKFAVQPYNDKGRYYIKREKDAASSVNPTKAYTLTTEEPEDWGTNYNDYYTKSGDEYIKNNEQTAPTWEADTYYSESTG